MRVFISGEIFVTTGSAVNSPDLELQVEDLYLLRDSLDESFLRVY